MYCSVHTVEPPQPLESYVRSLALSLPASRCPRHSATFRLSLPLFSDGARHHCHSRPSHRAKLQIESVSIPALPFVSFFSGCSNLLGMDQGPRCGAPAHGVSTWEVLADMLSRWGNALGWYPTTDHSQAHGRYLTLQPPQRPHPFLLFDLSGTHRQR